MTGRYSKQTHTLLMQCICKNERSLCKPFVIQKIAFSQGNDMCNARLFELTSGQYSHAERSAIASATHQ